MKSIIINSLLKNKISTLTLFLYSLAVGKTTSLIPKSDYNIYLFILLIFIELSFKYIKEILLTPIFNQAILQLKILNISNINNYTPATISTNFQKINSTKSMFNSIFDSIKDISTIIHFLIGLCLKEYIVISLYFTTFYIAQIYNIKARKKAWNSTENNLNNLHDCIKKSNLIKQSFFNTTSLKKSAYQEFTEWNSYYIKSNLAMLAPLALLSTYLFINQNNIFFKYLLIKTVSKFSNTLKSIYSIKSDLTFSNEKKEDINKKTQKKHKLSVTNLFFYNKGPFNFTTATNIIIKGKNGVGKTGLAKAIAGLIHYKGTIKAPKSLYLSLEDCIIDNKSKGESAVLLIEKAANESYDLIILDEILDILSEDNLINSFKKISKKQLIIITHKNLKLPLPTLYLKENTLTSSL